MRLRRSLGLDTDTRRKRDRANAATWSAKGLCRKCGRPPRPGLSRCADCAAEYQRRRDRALARGVCVRCEKQEPIAGRRICLTCRGRYESRRLRLIVGRKRARKYETGRRRTKARLDAGQCPTCTAPLAFGRLIVRGLSPRPASRQERT